MKLSIIIDFIAAWKAEILFSALMGAGMVWNQSPGYAFGAAFATVALWFLSRKKCPSDRIVVMIFTFVSGAWGGPLLAGMDSLQWIPRPQPMLGEWEAFGGFLVSSIGGTFLFAFVTALARRAERGGAAVADAVAKRLNFPESQTTAADMPNITLEEFDDLIAALPEPQRTAFKAFRERAADSGRSATREKHLRD